LDSIAGFLSKSKNLSYPFDGMSVYPVLHYACSDINECLTNNGGCDVNAACNNTIGSFTCACRTGYTGDGFNCTGTSYISNDDLNYVVRIQRSNLSAKISCGNIYNFDYSEQRLSMGNSNDLMAHDNYGQDA
jgi:hypothetical protein